MSKLTRVEHKRRIEKAIKENIKIIKYASTPHERDMARARKNILTSKLKKLEEKIDGKKIWY